MQKFVEYRYKLPQHIKDGIYKKIPEFGFNGFGETTYYRTYSRIKSDGSQEHWGDTVIRVVEGVMSIRIDWMKKNNIVYDQNEYDKIAEELAFYIFDMKMLPPGRGLWVMGSEYVYQRGSMSLFNCAAVEIKQPSQCFNWAMDALMCGVGVGFGVFRDNMIKLKKPSTNERVFVIPDSREGWVESLKLLLESWENGSERMVYDFSLIRPEGSPIGGFGGKASGPEPLKKMIERIELYCQIYFEDKISWTEFISNIANAIGCCIVAGNVRRSAEILIGHIDDVDFINLKNYDERSSICNYENKTYKCLDYHISSINSPPDKSENWIEIQQKDNDAPLWKPDHLYCGRTAIGWMSNNSVRLEKKNDFRQLPKIAKLIAKNGEPGILNLINMKENGKFGDRIEDTGDLTNPCGEIILESYELCNLSEVFPTRCNTKAEFYKALELAAFYSSTVSLLPTHREETNNVIKRNRRIGVSISGIADWISIYGVSDCIPMMRKGYKIVRETNNRLSDEAGVARSIRISTIKPSGSISQLAGVSSGIHFPTFKYAIRRIRISTSSPVAQILMEAGVPWEYDVYSDNTYVFEFPIDQGKTRPAKEVSAWEQFALLATMQREWADNMVSATIYFDPETEEGQLGYMLGQFAPVIKSVSILPHTDAGAYPQMPYEGITKEEYEKRKKAIKTINWADFGNSDGQDSKFCNNDTCSI